MCFARIVPVAIFRWLGGLNSRITLCLYGLCASHELFPSLPIGNLVGSSGLEPPTSRLSGVRSNQLSYEPILSFLSVLHLSFQRFWRCGGDEQNRTVDPLLARQVLSQLSYTPKVSSGVSYSAFRRPFSKDLQN